MEDIDYAALTFDPVEHRYWYQGRELTSVTKLVSKYKQEFKADYWAKRKAKEALEAEGLRGADLYEQLPSVAMALQEEWKRKRDTASETGRAVHAWAQGFFSEGVGGDPLPEHLWGYCNALEKFADDHEGISVISVEQAICNPHLGIAGTLDALLLRKGRVWLVDWKTNETLKMRSTSKMRKPVTFLPDCNWSHYTLQQNIYAWMLEAGYGYGELVDPLGKMIVHLKPDGAYEKCFVPDIDPGKLAALLVHHKETGGAKSEKSE